MTDPLRAAIVAELKRQAAESGVACWDLLASDGSAALHYDGPINLDAICAAIRRSLATPFEHQKPTTGETGKA